MSDYVFTSSQGITVLFQLRRYGRNKIVARCQPTDHRLRLMIPTTMTRQAVQQWLFEHETALISLWQQQQTHYRDREKIWFKGIAYPYRVSPDCLQSSWCAQNGFVLPPTNVNRFHHTLAHWLQQQATTYLLERLQYWSQQLNLHPVAMKLTAARTFWGVCRPYRGIRLNWRLIGAPLWVVDYVCIHELCHLKHLNHSPLFWQMVNHHTPHTQAAKTWLQQYGAQLFILTDEA